jgi:hypothetical protein
MDRSASEKSIFSVPQERCDNEQGVESRNEQVLAFCSNRIVFVNIVVMLKTFEFSTNNEIDVCY